MTLETIHSIGNGPVGGSLSIVDVLTCLYFGGLMNVDPANSKMEGRDRLIVSKGHAGPAVYATLAEKGFFPKEQLQTLDGYVSDICGLGNLKAKWESFGWQTYEIDGHDYDLILRTVQEAKTADGPVMILLDTVKGKGFSMAEALGYENHGMTIGDKELEQARKELAE